MGRCNIPIMASSSMVAVWEARAEQEVAELAKNTNTRKQSKTEYHRARLGSNRRKGGSGVSAESIESLDDILLSLQNAIVVNEDKAILEEHIGEEEKASKDENHSM